MPLELPSDVVRSIMACLVQPDPPKKPPAPLNRTIWNKSRIDLNFTEREVLPMLARASLVCRQWRALAQEAMYTNVLLTTDRALSLFTDSLRKEHLKDLASRVQTLTIEGRDDLITNVLIQSLLALLPNITWYRIHLNRHRDEAKDTKLPLPTSYNSKLERLTIDVTIPIDSNFIVVGFWAPSSVLDENDLKRLPPSSERLDLISVNLRSVTTIALLNLTTISLDEITLLSMKEDCRLECSSLAIVHICDVQAMAQHWKRKFHPVRKQLNEIHVHRYPTLAGLFESEIFIESLYQDYGKHIKFYLNGRLEDCAAA